jgi:cytochrome c peroxidase
MKLNSRLLIITLTMGALTIACGESGPSEEEKAKAAQEKKVAAEKKEKEVARQKAAQAQRERLEKNKNIARQMFQAIKSAAKPEGSDAEKVKLGQMLYHEKRISKNHDISCNSCHDVNRYGVDGKPTSPGHKGQLGGRNSPTVFNAFGHFAQFWDGRAATVEEQAKGPVLNPIEMAMPSERQVLRVLNSMPEYRKAFKAAFPKEKRPVTYQNFANAVGAFERQLSTPARFDAFLEGDDSALKEEELEGLAVFIEVGCTTCHSGALLGGQMYQKVGLHKPWPNQKDLGRFEVTQQEADKMMFKIPSLRNITQTGPYFHDGQTAELATAIKMMGEHQLGKELSDTQVNSMIVFLDTLTANPPAEYLAVPTLPESTRRTPKPNPK